MASAWGRHFRSAVVIRRGCETRGIAQRSVQTPPGAPADPPGCECGRFCTSIAKRLAQYFAGNPEAALQVATRALNIRPTWTPTLETLAICHAALGQFEEARSFVGQMRQLEKPPDTLAQMKVRRPDWEKIPPP